MLTMLLGGLWHGASWNFVVWGGLHGVYLVVHRGWRARVVPRLGAVAQGRAYAVMCWLVTMGAVGLAWVFFRCCQWGDSLWVLRQLLGQGGLGCSLLSAAACGVLAATLGIAWLCDRRALAERFDGAHWSRRGIVFAVMLFVLTVFAATDGPVTFLYFQF